MQNYQIYQLWYQIIIVNYSINDYISNQYAIYGNKSILFFTIPSIRKILISKYGTEGRVRWEKAIINDK